MKLTSFVAAAAMAALGTAALADGHGGKIKVGMITTLSGGGAYLGADVRDGFKLALKMAGDSNVELIVEDDQRKPELAVQLADQMIPVSTSTLSDCTILSNLLLAVAPSVTAQGKFYLSPNAGPSVLAGRGCHPNYFNVSWQNDAFSEAAGAIATENGVKKVFLMAPNYPAGKDMMSGFKRFFDGEVSNEVYTKLGQTDYAAEIAQIRASDADQLYFFLPGGMGISFMKQYADSGIDMAMMGPAFSFDQGILGAIGEAALGVKNTSHWSRDLDNPANKAFVEAYTAEYDRIPTLYASQGFDTANLLLSAMAKADIKDADAFRSALEAADFASTRGDFAFGNNHHPIQTIYLREVIKDGDVVTNKLIGTASVGHTDAYAGDCKM